MPVATMTSRLEFWNVFSNDLYPVAQCEPLAWVGSNRRVKCCMSNSNTC